MGGEREEGPCLSQARAKLAHALPVRAMLPTCSTILALSNAGGAAWPVNQATIVELLSLNHPPADMCTACFFDVHHAAPFLALAQPFLVPCRPRTAVFGSLPPSHSPTLLLNSSPAQIGDMGLSSLTKGEEAIKGKKMQVRTNPRLSMREWLLMPALGRFGLCPLPIRCWLAPLPAGHLAMDGA
jgi:hypothetical protein